METFRVARQVVDECVVVSNDAICAAIKDVFEERRAILEFRAETKAAVAAAFDDLRAAHPDETFYAFALYTDDGAAGISPAANSEEGLAAVIAAYGEDAEPEYLRWATSEWAYEGFGWDRTAAVYGRIGEMGEEAEDFDAFYRGVLALMEGVLADLDAERFFGRGAERESVTLLCAVTDSDEDEDLLERTIRALNPPAVVARYEGG